MGDMDCSVERKIPSWLLEFTILAVLLFILRWWLGQQNRRTTLPVSSGAVKASRSVTDTHIWSAQKEAPAPTVRDRAVSPVSIPSDDLKLIKGIGPKVVGLLNVAGIHTFAQLADQDEASLRALLKEAGLAMINPSTWSEQARQMAAQGSEQAALN